MKTPVLMVSSTPTSQNERRAVEANAIARIRAALPLPLLQALSLGLEAMAKERAYGSLDVSFQLKAGSFRSMDMARRSHFYGNEEPAEED